MIDISNHTRLGLSGRESKYARRERFEKRAFDAAVRSGGGGRSWVDSGDLDGRGDGGGGGSLRGAAFFPRERPASYFARRVGSERISYAV